MGRDRPNLTVKAVVRAISAQRSTLNHAVEKLIRTTILWRIIKSADVNSAAVDPSSAQNDVST
jgi:hypothetical protein